ncbi:major histocompatibility complex class I-related gene protein-like [Poecilia formosa]|uniref:major histocompatibility complex class I-related gene protein-like n=1 Tax=Poecilia formosa TaxID=48698 RepID=UPI0007B813A9|nr:PREDICTED: major histocompatibility complex class I-related gene protein-like [Poecilia formosa]
MEMFLLLLLLHCVSSVKHTLMLMGVGSSGLPNLPTFCANIEIDEIRVAYCDSNRKTLNSTFDSSYSGFCFHLPDIFANKLNYLKDFQYEAVDILQVIAGCEWDDVTGEAGILLKHAYNGEDLFEWDVKNLTWIAKSHQAVMVKDKWKNDEDARLEMNLSLLMKFCPERLKKDVAHGDNSQQKRGLPSVSLLQKTPSSPIRCHVTGFYPNRGQLYWRENGEEIHEYVEHGEILPNPDGTFQMSVDFNVSSIPLEDWGKYDCVFQQPGLGNITTKLDKAVIRTNRVSPTDFPSHVISGVVVGLVLLVALFISGFIFWKKKNNGFQPANRSDQIEDNTELQSFKEEARTIDDDQTSSNEQNHEKANGAEQRPETGIH